MTVERNGFGLPATSRRSTAAPRRVSPARLRGILALDDFEEHARRFLPRPIFGYIASGSETNASLHDNRAAFKQYALLPRALVDVSRRSHKTTLFGVTHSPPFGIAPVGFSALSAYRGDIVLARAAARAGIPMIMSGASLIRMEDVAKAAPGSWFQAYLPGRTDVITAHLERIAAAGFNTLVITVDVPVVSNRENGVRSGFSAPLRPSLRLAWHGLVRPRWTIGTFLRTLTLHGMPHFENASVERGPPIIARNVANHLAGRDQLDWKHIAFIRENWAGRLVLKGVLRGEDARRAVGCGVDGLIVSNHGGRQLDGAPSPLRVLPDIADAVAGAVPVMFDSGVRRGTDVLKALALGASFVFLGRPFIYAAAIAGKAGVLHAHKLLSEEIDRDMALLGINTLSDLTSDFLKDTARERACSERPRRKTRSSVGL
ncbi:alpha-hydroxy acid oxidase [Rhodoligotrophos defluvii]|uniref:alpha-hydroxy acid oxidase n=1 Tax=Rhodoligotrophos defluvii TaxID=2561934 RepID=UPI0010C97D91|nr:alpha-hydroxy acid oxidase [Rhodoligotrophos defluvii]